MKEIGEIQPPYIWVVCFFLCFNMLHVVLGSDDSDSVLLWDLTRRILKWWEEGALYHFTGR